jgi:hypothetical protein
MVGGKATDPDGAALDRDVLTIATILIERYGDGARMHALLRVSDLLGPRDDLARRLWMQVIDAIEALHAGH